MKICQIHRKLGIKQMHIYASCARECALILMIFFLVIFYSFMNLSLKFDKYPSFRCGDIDKIECTLAYS